MQCIMNIRLCLICIFQAVQLSYQHRCIHDETAPPNIQTTNVNYEDSLRGKRSVNSVYEHLRVTPYYYDLSTLDFDDQEKVAVIVKKAINVVEHVLSVIPVSGPLVLSRTFAEYCRGTLGGSGINSGKCAYVNPGYEYEMCDDVQIPNDHLDGAWLWNSTHPTPVHEIKPQGRGLSNTDIVIYLKTSDCESEGVLAFAKFCRVDQNGRPIAGVINFCPHAFQDTTDLDRFTTVAIHEIFHILGFSQSLYDHFRDCSESASGLDCPIRVNTVRTNSNGQSVLVTPMVKAKAMKHFNCSEANYGLLLENQDSKSHWELRMMVGSIMAPVITQAHVTFLDPITLSLFEDSGWYKADYQYAQTIPWGRNAGCNFGFTDTCSDSSFFCPDESLSGCHYLHGDKGRCLTNKYLESCNFFTVSDKGLCSDEMNYDFSDEAVELREIYGISSRCFVADLVNETGVNNPTGRCYQTRCNMTERTYEILLEGSDWHPCHINSNISIAGLTGQIFCPSFEVICQNYSSILDLINNLPEFPEVSSLEPTTHVKAPDVFIATDKSLVIEISFNGTESNTIDVNDDETFLNEVNQLVLSSTNISQDRLEVLEAELTFEYILVMLNIQHSNIHCMIPSHDIYKTLETVVNAHLFTVTHDNHNLTATMIRIVEEQVEDHPAAVTTSMLVIVVVSSTIAAGIILFFLMCICKRKAFSQRVAPLETYGSRTESTIDIKMQPTRPRRKKPRNVNLSQK